MGERATPPCARRMWQDPTPAEWRYFFLFFSRKTSPRLPNANNASQRARTPCLAALFLLTALRQPSVLSARSCDSGTIGCAQRLTMALADRGLVIPVAAAPYPTPIGLLERKRWPHFHCVLSSGPKRLPVSDVEGRPARDQDYHAASMATRCRGVVARL